MLCTTVTNFCSEGKVILLLSLVRYQVFFFLDTHDTDTITITKLCKLKLQVFYHVLSYKSATGLSGLF